MQDALFAQNRTQFNSILDTVTDFGIILGSEQSYDKVAAALAFYLSLNASGKKAQIISKTDPRVEVSNLVGVNKIKKGFDGVVNQFIFQLPYREGEIEKVSYSGDGDVLSINVVGGENGISFTEDDIKIVKNGSTPAVIVTVGVQNEAEIAEFVKAPNIQVINIDNQAANTGYGNLLYSIPEASSTSEIAGKLIIESGLAIDQDIAQNIMNGVISSTSNFSTPQTTPTAFEVAAFLMRQGAQRQKVKQDRREPIRPEFQPKSKNDNNPHKPKSDGQQSQSMNFDETGSNAIPHDWFAPKVFRGSKRPQDE